MSNLQETIEYLVNAENLNEGYLAAMGSDIKHGFKNLATVTDLTKDTQESLRLTKERAAELIEYIKEFDKDYPKTNLAMGEFKTWFKANSQTEWRYYFLLDNSTFSKIKANVAKNENSKLDSWFDINKIGRSNAANILDSAKSAKDLITIVNIYNDRAQMLGKQLLKNNAPNGAARTFLYGMTDLQGTVKRICNLSK